MCEPVTAGLILTGVSTSLAAVGQMQAQKAANAQAEFAAQQAERNARAREKDAEVSDERAREAFDAVRETREEGGRARLRQAQAVRDRIDKQKEAFAANNVFSMDESAADLQDETAMLGRQDRHSMFLNTERQAFGYFQQGRDAMHQAGQLRDASGQLRADAAFKRSTKSNSLLPMLGTIAEGGSQALGNINFGGNQDVGNYQAFQAGRAGRRAGGKLRGTGASLNPILFTG